MNVYKPRAPSLILACLVAGPAFVWTNIVVDLYLRLPQPIVASLHDIAGLLMVSLIAALFGFVLALLPTSLGTLLMHGLGQHLEAARAPLAWTVAGAAIGAGLALAFGAWPAMPETAFPSSPPPHSAPEFADAPYSGSELHLPRPALLH